MYVKTHIKLIAADLEQDTYCFIIRPHGVANLYLPAAPFFAVKTTKDVACNRPTKASTPSLSFPVKYVLLHSYPQFLRNILWNDVLVVKMEKQELEKNAGIFIALIDNAGKSYLATLILPTSQVIPGEQYNFRVFLGEDEKPPELFFSMTMQKNLGLQKRLYEMCPSSHIFEAIRKGLPPD